MSFVKKINLYGLLGLLISSVGLPANTAHAAPGALADYPLFLANSAEANVFFMVDDSGSMDVEMMTPEGIAGWGGVMDLDDSATVVEYLYLFGEGCTASEVAAAQAIIAAGGASPDPDCDQNGETDDPDNYRSWSGTSAQNTYVNAFILPTQAYIDTTYSGSMNDTLRGVWRGRNSDYNTLYYDPTKDYEPWTGENNAGVAYPDYRNKTTYPSPVTSVPLDPYYTSGPTFDLITTDSIPIDQVNGTDDEMSYYPAAYWVWEDTDGDGNVDANVLEDRRARIEIRTGTSECSGDKSKSDQITNSCMLRAYDDEIRNFANWFVYHRKRDYTAKYALSRVIAPEEKVRMGISTINNNQSNSKIELASMNLDYTTGNKQTLLNGMFQVNSNGSTPLRSALQLAGNYFACSGETPFGTGSSSICALQLNPINAGESAPAVCQQNFTVLISDGERSTGGGQDSFYTNSSFGSIGNDDGDSSTFSGDYYPDGVTTSISDFNFAGEPYADTIDDTLADVAMHFYERDLHPSVDNRVPISCGVDENPAQHMVTFTVGFGVDGAVDLNTLPTHPGRGYAPGGCTDTTASATDFAWTYQATAWNNFNPDEKIDDMVHAAFNARGKYYSAKDPDLLSSSLSDAIQNINNRSASSASAAFNAAVISSDTQIYLTRFHSGSWTGTLQAYGLNADGTLAGLSWDAASIMNSDPYDLRAIATFDPSTGAGTEFVWSNLVSTQQADLRKNANNSVEADTGGTPAFPVAEARLEFLRGDRSCEQNSTGVCPPAVGKIFRSRVGILGDLVNSTPVFVGAPLGDYPNTAPFGTDTESYSSFKFGQTGSNGAFDSGETARTRTPMVYVGGNDGMMHAFIADSSTDAGRELWAFIPNSVFSDANDRGLHELTEPGYEHQYYVDLTPTVIDVYGDYNNDNDDDWHTVLIGGLRGGGAGLFAIDVTDPDYIRNAGMSTASEADARESRLADKVLWEFTAADDPDLGHTFSEPAVVPLGTSSGIEWYVVVGNGYESGHTDSGSHSQDDGNPYASKLFLIKLSGPTGAGGSWVLGTDYYKMDTRTPAGTTAGTNRNGMSSPALADNDGDGIFDRAFAGDILGNLWVMDLTGNPANNNEGWSFAYKSGSTPQPLFIASDGDGGAGNRQPITMRPALARHPSVATVSSGGGVNEPNIMVYFGTGQYLTSSDLNTTGTQSFYAVWDRGDDNRTVNRSTPSSSNNHLQRQTISESTIATSGGGTQGVRVIDPDTNGDGTVDADDNMDYTTQPMHGWYIDLPTSGERSIFNPLIRGGMVFFNSLIPSKDPCGFGGSGWIMAANLNDGKSPDDPFLDANADGSISNADTVGNVAIIGLEVTGGIPGAGALIAGSPAPPGPPGPPNPPPCEPPKKPHVEVVLDSSGNPTTVNLCLPEGAKVGRYSWRELFFD